MDVVQKLDDDFFRLRHLPFDEVLQVQKWLMFSCCQPLECAECAQPQFTHSTLLIVCDRITQIFACLCRRFHKISTGTMGIDAPPLETWPPSPAPELTVPSQLFDGTTGQPGMGGACTVDIFRERFSEEHSQEEQLLTIQVLMKSHIRNFSKLLDRVGAMPQSQQSQARTGRVRNLKTYLEHLTSVLDADVQDQA
jgi:hypothetical protein